MGILLSMKRKQRANLLLRYRAAYLHSLFLLMKMAGFLRTRLIFVLSLHSVFRKQNAFRRALNGKCIEWIEGHYTYRSGESLRFIVSTSALRTFNLFTSLDILWSIFLASNTSLHLKPFKITMKRKQMWFWKSMRSSHMCSLNEGFQENNKQIYRLDWYNI